MFRQSLNELGCRYLTDKEVLLDYVKSLAKQILLSELEPVEGVEKIDGIYFQLGFPEELEYWRLLAEGSSREWEDKTWIPWIYKFNDEKWREAVMREAKVLTEKDFS